MKSRLFIRKAFPVLLVVLCAVLLSWCSGNRDDSISYSGSTKMAVITANNSVELTLDAYYGGPVRVDIPINRTAEASGGETLFLLQHGMLLYSSLSRKMIENFTIYGDTAPQLRTIETETSKILGNCGGSKTSTLNINDTTGNFTNTIWDDNYCEDGITSSGTINASGGVNLDTFEITEMNMSFDLWTISSSSYSITFSGTISSDLTVNSQTLTLNYLIRDNNSDNVSRDKVYKVENYVTSTALLIDRVETTVSDGRFYHPDYGYVDLISEQPFILYSGDFAVSSGELSITGAMQTKALLTVHSINDIEITADTDGDGVFEWSSVILD